MNTISVIYILHFRDPLCHARHYTGSTRDLTARLAKHAAGKGARLTQVLVHLGRPWVLGAVGKVLTGRRRRVVERLLKRQHNAARYCEVCRGSHARQIPGTRSLPLTMLARPEPKPA